MDPISQVDFSKDSTVAIIKNLQRMAKIKLIIPDSIDYDSNNIFASSCDLEIVSLRQKKYVQKNNKRINLNKLDCIFFRKDPPVDGKYISILQMLRELEYQDTLVINSPGSLIRFNEKVLGCQLSMPKIPTIISSSSRQINNFLRVHRVIVLKPMNLMAGQGIIKLDLLDGSKYLISNYIKKYGVIMAQKYLSEIKNGDNRIIIYNGIIEENILTRYPPKGDFIANLSNGGIYKIRTLKKKHLPTIRKVASYLTYHGIFFAGVDMIGDYITEINITSPTGIQQIGNRLPTKIATELIKNIDNYYT